MGSTCAANSDIIYFLVIENIAKVGRIIGIIKFYLKHQFSAFKAYFRQLKTVITKEMLIFARNRVAKKQYFKMERPNQESPVSKEGLIAIVKGIVEDINPSGKLTNQHKSAHIRCYIESYLNHRYLFDGLIAQHHVAVDTSDGINFEISIKYWFGWHSEDNISVSAKMLSESEAWTRVIGNVGMQLASNHAMAKYGDGGALERWCNMLEPMANRMEEK